MKPITSAHASVNSTLRMSTDRDAGCGEKGWSPIRIHVGSTAAGVPAGYSSTGIGVTVGVPGAATVGVAGAAFVAGTVFVAVTVSVAVSVAVAVSVSVAVIVALTMGAPFYVVNLLAVLYVVLRIAHALLYILDKPMARSLMFAAAMMVNVVIFVLPAFR